MTDNRGHAPAKEKTVQRQAEKERGRIESQEDEVVVSSDESFLAGAGHARVE